MIVGVPFYGTTFTLSNSKNNGVGSRTTGPGNAGTFTQQVGILGYYEVKANE